MADTDTTELAAGEPTSEDVVLFYGGTKPTFSPDALKLLELPGLRAGSLDCCRLPVFAPPRAGQSANLKQQTNSVKSPDPWRRCGTMNAAEVFVDGVLRMGRDESTLDFYATRFAAEGFPHDTALPIDLGELAAFQTGRPAHSLSTKDRWLAWESIDRTHRARLRFEADTTNGPLGVAFHIITAMVDDAGPMRFDPKRKIPPSTFAAVVLDPVYAHLLRSGRYVWHLEGLDALRGNPRAAKLGRFLRGETFNNQRPRKEFTVFEAEPGCSPKGSRRTPAIADLLAYTWTQPVRADKARRVIVADVRRVCAYLTAHDPEYSAAVERAGGVQMWKVVAWRKTTTRELSTGADQQSGAPPNWAVHPAELGGTRRLTKLTITSSRKVGSGKMLRP